MQVFQICHNLCSELTSILAIQKQLNKSDRPQVNIWDTWKTLKYLNINDSFHLKDLEISKYKRES
jgi:thymidylate synthase